MLFSYYYCIIIIVNFIIIIVNSPQPQAISNNFRCVWQYHNYVQIKTRTFNVIHNNHINRFILSCVNASTYHTKSAQGYTPRHSDNLYITLTHILTTITRNTLCGNNEYFRQGLHH